MQAHFQDSGLAYIPLTPLPEAAFQVVEDGLVSCGFASSAIVKDYRLLSDKALIEVNALAFAHPSQRDLDGYAGMTVYNAAHGHRDSTLVKRHLAISSAPFHLIHHESTFSFWISKATAQQKKTVIDPIKIEDAIAYERLGEVFRKYQADLKPQRIIDVKKGRDTFQFFPQIRPWQLSLWALEVRRKPLVRCFETAVDALRHHPSGLPNEQAQRIATQLLGALILADTGMFGQSVRLVKPSFDVLLQVASEKYPNFFHNQLLLGEYRVAAEAAYTILCSINYAGFVPGMLGDLYAAAYAREDRKQLGNYNTPLYLARRMWDSIPVEYLPPQERVVADMTCGLGSFLVAGYERFMHLSDVNEMPLQKCLYGNDHDAFFAQLTRLGLLYATARDDWEIGQTDAFEWEKLQEYQPTIIIGNPPFGREDRVSDDEEGTNSKQEKSNQKAYQFLEYALACLKPGGYLAMIMPRSFAVLQNGSALRQKLLEDCDIFELWDLPQQVFEGQDATSRTTVIFLQKNKSQSGISRHCVRVRTIQPVTLKVFENTGIYTASHLEVDQSVWHKTSWQSGLHSRSEHVIDYKTILPPARWEEISRHCQRLGACSRHGRGAKFAAEETVSGVKKVLLPYIQTPSWGRRAKAAIEPHSYSAAKYFWSIVPYPNASLTYQFTSELLVAILNWDVSNAWIVEHLKSPYISAYALETIPVPTSLSSEDCAKLETAVRTLEREGAFGDLPSIPSQEAQDNIDSILKKAYNLNEDTFRRLRRVMQWDRQPLITLDPQPDLNRADWFVSGIVGAVSASDGIIRLWINGFEDVQTVQIVPSMPGWLLRPDAAFLTKVPEEDREGRHIDQHTFDWGTFYPQPYMYMTDEELLEGIAQHFVLKEQE